MRILNIDIYRDGGSISIDVSLFVHEIKLYSFEHIPAKRVIDTQESVFQVWRDYAIDSGNKGVYFIGDINGGRSVLHSDSDFVKSVIDRVASKYESKWYYAQKFIK